MVSREGVQAFWEISKKSLEAENCTDFFAGAAVAFSEVEEEEGKGGGVLLSSGGVVVAEEFCRADLRREVVSLAGFIVSSLSYRR